MDGVGVWLVTLARRPRTCIVLSCVGCGYWLLASASRIDRACLTWPRPFLEEKITKMTLEKIDSWLWWHSDGWQVGLSVSMNVDPALNLQTTDVSSLIFTNRPLERGLSQFHQRKRPGRLKLNYHFIFMNFSKLLACSCWVCEWCVYGCATKILRGYLSLSTRTCHVHVLRVTTTVAWSCHLV